MGNYDILIFGEYTFDLIITGLPETPRLGADIFGTGMGAHAGGTFNTVRALHRLGLKVGWVCDIGNDLFSQYVLDEVRREGIDISLFRFLDRPHRSFSLAFSFAEDRGFISYADPSEGYDPVPYVIEHQPRCVVLPHLRCGQEVSRLAQTAHEIGALVCMDCQSTRETIETPGIKEILRQIDIFMPNAGEAIQFTGAPTAEEAAEQLAALTPLVVVKLGARGAIVRYGDRTIYSPALDVAVIDTTGAGDCFNAGFLYGVLEGKSLEDSLRAGNICGSMSTTQRGSGASPQLEDLIRYLGS